MTDVLGWDIGGVNTKVAHVVDGEIIGVQTRPFELQRVPGDLVALLGELAAALGGTAREHAVTMTAELSQMFRTKREGVAFVLDSVETAFPDATVHVYTTDGIFVSPSTARRNPLTVAAANWVATARVVAEHHPHALLIDVGTTTTDLIPIVDGAVAAAGRTDPDRLASGELVYSGAVRTPVEALVRQVPLGSHRARVSAEGFALIGDVHVWTGRLDPADYDAATPDGRSRGRPAAGERLARVICADREMLDAAAIDAIAKAVADAQVSQIAAAIGQVCARHASLRTAVVTGLGAFVGAAAARAARLDVVRLSDTLGDAGARSAPAAAVALLLDRAARAGERAAGGRSVPADRQRAILQAQTDHTVAVTAHDASSGTPGSAHLHWTSEPPDPAAGITVVKIGGGLLAQPDEWRTALAVIASVAASRRLVLVPGGGPFAEAVRDVDTRIGLSETVAHWMAIAGMDQHADMIAAAQPGFIRVVDPPGIEQAHADGHVPVLAPATWLRATDPLPHSWDVTSDSIAAWVAGAVAAQRLILVKVVEAAGPDLLDRYFPRACPPGLEWLTCDAPRLAACLQGHEPSRR